MLKNISFFLVVVFVPLISVAQFSTQIVGCEATDMARSVPQLDDGVWVGQLLSIGDWTFSPSIKISCGHSGCVVNYSNDIRAEGIPLTAPHQSQISGFNPHTGQIFGNTVTLTTKNNAGGVQRTVSGRLAQSLYKSVLNDKRSFKDAGAIKIVHMNYGYVGQIQIRIRTDMSCSDEEQCSINEDVVVFIPYSEVNECVDEEAQVPVG
jgi:hypothetical protein